MFDFIIKVVKGHNCIIAILPMNRGSMTFMYDRTGIDEAKARLNDFVKSRYPKHKIEYQD
jgi:ABC-type thiamine transport system substrate-binding protein